MEKTRKIRFFLKDHAQLNPHVPRSEKARKKLFPGPYVLFRKKFFRGLFRALPCPVVGVLTCGIGAESEQNLFCRSRCRKRGVFRSASSGEPALTGFMSGLIAAGGIAFPLLMSSVRPVGLVIGRLRGGIADEEKLVRRLKFTQRIGGSRACRRGPSSRPPRCSAGSCVCRC